MKYTALLAVALLVSDASAFRLETLPDVRADTVSDEDIAAHEAARSEAAKVKKNPQSQLLASVKTDLDQISKDLSFGISFSQSKKRPRQRALHQGRQLNDGLHLK